MKQCLCDTPFPLPCVSSLESLPPFLVLGSARGGFLCSLSLGNGRAPFPLPCPSGASRMLLVSRRPPLHSASLFFGESSAFLLMGRKCRP